MKMEKICSKCGECKPASKEFFYSSGSRGYLKSICKTCDNKRRADAAAEERKTGKFKDRDAMYAKKYQERRADSWKDYYHRNRSELIKKASKNYINRYRTDDLFKMKCKIRTFVGESVRRKGFEKSEKTEQILGISLDGFINHIESRFSEGMTWENRSEWHIDHIIPLATAKTEEDVIRLNHYTNLRPLWAIDNLRKGAKLDWKPR